MDEIRFQVKFDESCTKEEATMVYCRVKGKTVSRRQTVLWKTVFFVLGIVSLLLSVIFFHLVMQGEIAYGSGVFSIAFGIIYGSYGLYRGICYYYVWARRIKKSRSKMKKFEESILCFYDDRMYEKTARGETTCVYSDTFYAFYLWENYLVLFYDEKGNRGFMIHKSYLQKGTMEEFCKFLTEKTGIEVKRLR